MTDDELYLILHKVRGEPAFDIAQKIMIGDEEGWIIPTSGHRAHPHQIWKLLNLRNHVFGEIREIAICDIPDDWPDHYDVSRDDRSYMEDQARTILMRRGLLKPKPVNNYRRR